MEQLVEFNYNDNKLDVYIIDGLEYFVAKDVCDILGISNVSDALKPLDDDEKLTSEISRSGQKRMVNLVTESGLYYFTLRSNKPEARRFQKWVTSDVLPSIRKHGAYLTTPTIESVIADPDNFIQLAIALRDEREKRKQVEKSNETLRTSHNILKQIANTDELLTMDQVAKIINVPKVGRNKMYRVLRENKIVNSRNVPMQEYVNRGYFKLKDKLITRSSGNFTVVTTLCTQKGLMWLCKFFNIDTPKNPVNQAV